MDPVTLRAIERILAVIIGGFCVYLGYRLFLHIPEHNQSEGKFDLPGGISIYVTRVGPGVFFALFGAAVVALSLYASVSYVRQTSGGLETRNAEPMASRTVTEGYSGMTQQLAAGNKEKLTEDQIALRFEIALLNALPSYLRTDLSRERHDAIQGVITKSKLSLMNSVWKKDWGGFDEFRIWAEGGASDPVPESLRSAAAFYRYKEEGGK